MKLTLIMNRCSLEKNNGVVPTEFGRAFYPKATEVLDSFNKAVEFIGDYRDKIKGKESFPLFFAPLISLAVKWFAKM